MRFLRRSISMRIISALTAPEYFYQPWQLVRRLRRPRRGEVVVARLIWGLPIEFEADMIISFDIVNRGVFDRVIPELACRLLDTGEVGVDVGGHAGQNASAMALAVGREGRVVAYEPHPKLLGFLRRNAKRWKENELLAPVEVSGSALSDAGGVCVLYEPDGFAANTGSATLEPSVGLEGEHEVAVTTLDAAFAGDDSPIGFLKLDVERHEAKVLRGAERLIDAGRIRDIVYEQLAGSSSEVNDFLEAKGYTLFAMKSGFSGPALFPLSEARGGVMESFLATLDEDRVRRRMAPGGWRCLRRGFGRR